MVCIEKLESDSKKVMDSEYMHSYPHLVSYFEGKEDIEVEDFIRGVHMVYAWMPTILTVAPALNDKGKKKGRDEKNRVPEDFEDFKKVINKVISDAVESINKLKKLDSLDSLDEADIKNIKKAVNNSVVGASKLLHFIEPDKFPIWDSRVRKYLGKNIKGGSDESKYLQYIKIVNDIIEMKKPFIECLCKKFEITPVRAVELIMFQNSP